MPEFKMRSSSLLLSDASRAYNDVHDYKCCRQVQSQWGQAQSPLVPVVHKPGGAAGLVAGIHRQALQPRKRLGQCWPRLKRKRIS